MSAAQDEVDKLFASKDHRTTHPEDDARSDSDRSTGSDRENRSPAASPSAAEIRDGPATIPYRKAHGNTGPKGVIRDAQSYRSAQLKAASTVELSLDQVSIRDSGLGVQPATNSGLLRPGSSRRSDDGDEDEEFGDDDGSFMEQWRRSRLRQLQTSTTKGTPSPAVVPVDGDGYLDAVDRSGASTVVVVYIYDESSEVSHAVEACLTKVARRASSRQRNIKFVKLRYQEAEMEPAGVPALLAYRNGEKFAGLVPLVDEIPDDADLSETTLEVMLQKHQIL